MNVEVVPSDPNDSSSVSVRPVNPSVVLVRPLTENFNPSSWPGRKREGGFLIEMDRPHGVRVVPAEVLALPAKPVHDAPELAVGDLVLIEVGRGILIDPHGVLVPMRVNCEAGGGRPGQTNYRSKRLDLVRSPFRPRDESVFKDTNQAGRGVVAMLVDGEAVSLDYGDRPSAGLDLVVVDLVRPEWDKSERSGLVLPPAHDDSGFDTVTWDGAKYAIVKGAGCPLGLATCTRIAVCLQDILFKIE